MSQPTNNGLYALFPTNTQVVLEKEPSILSFYKKDIDCDSEIIELRKKIADLQNESNSLSNDNMLLSNVPVKAVNKIIEENNNRICDINCLIDNYNDCVLKRIDFVNRNNDELDKDRIINGYLDRICNFQNLIHYSRMEINELHKFGGYRKYELELIDEHQRNIKSWDACIDEIKQDLDKHIRAIRSMQYRKSRDS
jgi:DNA repair ATPase RecN